METVTVVVVVATVVDTVTAGAVAVEVTGVIGYLEEHQLSAMGMLERGRR